MRFDLQIYENNDRFRLKSLYFTAYQDYYFKLGQDALHMKAPGPAKTIKCFNLSFALSRTASLCLSLLNLSEPVFIDQKLSTPE